MTSKRWFLICYDVRDPDRLRACAKTLLGWGERIQYSIFRCRLNKTELEKLKWELSQILDAEDSLMIIGLCPSCVKRIGAKGNTVSWTETLETYKIV